jgi:ligand-binding sensor domain-containing protein
MLILFLLAALCARAGTGDYLIDVWTGENGLPNSSVTAIAQTPDGYLWVGTYNGLARFDGVRFVKFDPDTNPELKRARVRKLYVDAQGTLWISTYDGSLTSYKDGVFSFEWQGDGSFDATISAVSLRSNNIVFLLHTGQLIRKRPLNSTDGSMSATNSWQVLRPPGLSSGTLCVEDASGVLWGRGRDQRIWKSSGDQFELLSANSGLQGTAVHTLSLDWQGRVWVGTDRELAVWNGSAFQSMVPTNGEPSLNISWVCFSTNREAWIIANERVRRAQGRQWVFEAEPCRGLFSGYQDRLGMQEDRNGAAWLYHYGRGLFHIRRDGQTRQLDLEENFPGERVDCFYEDREGNLWCGVDRGGLVRLRQKRFVTLSPGNSRQRTDLPAELQDETSVWRDYERGAAKAAVSVAEDNEGAIWIGTYGGGLHRLFDGEWQRYSIPAGSRRSFVFGVCPGNDDRLWLSAGDEDLFVRTKTQLQSFTPVVHGVKAMLSASDGRIWIGNKSGLWLWNKSQMRMFRAEDGIRRTDIRALAEDTNRAIWAGAGDGLLYRIVSNHVERFQPTDALAGQPIWSLYADEDQTIWVGTFRGGLLRFKDGQFIRYTSKDGLPDDVVCQVLEDGDHRLWIGSQQGIFSVARTNLDAFAAHKTRAVSCTAYGRYDGLPSLECSGGYQPAAWKTRDGRLLFSTLGGVVSVQPEDLAPNRLPPPVVLEEVLLNGRKIDFPPVTLRGPLVAGRGSLTIEPGKRQIEFRYTGLSFVSPDRVRFRYKLEGQDNDWTEAGTYRSAQYNYLRPGPYTFRVSACNNDGVWNEAGAALAFEMLPYFYETTSFRIAAWVIGAAVVGVTVRQIVVRRLQRRLRDLERQQAIERDRARIAQDIHDDLGAGLTQIMLLSELARREPAPEVQNHLGQISDMARGLTRAMDEIVWAVDPQHDTLTGFMDYASAFTEEFLRAAGLRCR